MGEFIEGNGAMLDQPPMRRIRSERLVLIPKDYSIGPVFAARKHPESREVVVNARRYQIGGSDPQATGVGCPPCPSAFCDVKFSQAG